MRLGNRPLQHHPEGSWLLGLSSRCLQTPAGIFRSPKSRIRVREDRWRAAEEGDSTLQPITACRGGSRVSGTRRGRPAGLRAGACPAAVTRINALQGSAFFAGVWAVRHRGRPGRRSYIGSGPHARHVTPRQSTVQVFILKSTTGETCAVPGHCFHDLELETRRAPVQDYSRVNVDRLRPESVGHFNSRIGYAFAPSGQPGFGHRIDSAS